MAAMLSSSGWCQSPGDLRAAWLNPVSFDATNAGASWALIANVKGTATSDGGIVKVTVEHIDLYRPKTFDQAQDINKITVGIIRTGANGERRWVLFGDSHTVNETLNPDQKGSLGPFELRIKLTDYPLLKGDALAFNLLIGSQGRPASATVPVYVKDALPVTQVAAYCADRMEEIRRPEGSSLIASHVCYDSNGRTRTETWSYPSRNALKSAATLTSIEILDPVANLIYTLYPNTKKAVRRKGFTSAAGFGKPIGGIIGWIPGGPLALKPVESDKMLGTKVIGGVEADGKLHTTVYPAGYQKQAEESTVTTETWYAFRVQAQVRRISTDPRNGGSEYGMTHIQLGEPDRALFQVPEDYEITEIK